MHAHGSRGRAAKLLVGLMLVSACTTAGPSDPAEPGTFVAAPDGSATATGSADDPMSVQAALDAVGPGDVIELDRGTYDVESPLRTRTAGTPDRPITIKGDEKGMDVTGRNSTVLRGGRHVIDIDHSHYVLDGFSVDGQPQLDFDDIPTTPTALVAFKDDNQSRVADGQLIYIGARERGVTGTVITNMFLTGAGRECVRMRSYATGNSVTKSRILRCGFARDDKDYPYHNGEGVYIGTSPKSTDQPYYDSDSSTRNLVRDNIIETYGSECVNIKENATENIIDGNLCRFGLGPAGDNESVLEVRGSNNDITGNTIQDSAGLGIKIWSDDVKYGGGNVVARNRLSDIAGDTISVKLQTPPPTVCENSYEGDGATTAGLDDPDITKPCAGGTDTSP